MGSCCHCSLVSCVISHWGLLALLSERAFYVVRAPLNLSFAGITPESCRTNRCACWARSESMIDAPFAPELLRECDSRSVRYCCSTRSDALIGWSRSGTAVTPTVVVSSYDSMLPSKQPSPLYGSQTAESISSHRLGLVCIYHMIREP